MYVVGLFAKKSQRPGQENGEKERRIAGAPSPPAGMTGGGKLFGGGEHFTCDLFRAGGIHGALSELEGG